MAISGAFAGLAGSIDILGWQFRLDLTVVQTVAGRLHRHRRGAARPATRRSASCFSALLFGALLTGTSTRNLDPSVFQPQLAGNLTRIIQGLVVLFVGADLLIIYLWQARKKLRLPTAKGGGAADERRGQPLQRGAWTRPRPRRRSA